MKTIKWIGACFVLLTSIAVNAPAYTLTSAQLQAMGTSAANFVDNYGQVPNYVTAPDGSHVSAAEFFYLMTRWVPSPASYYVYKGIGAAPAPGGSLTNGTIWKSNLVASCQSAANFITSNGQLPNYITVNGVHASPAVLFAVMAKNLRFYQSNGVLPNYTTVTPCDNPDVWAPPFAVGKSFFITGTDAQSAGISNVVNQAAANGIQDIFLLIKGTSGTYNFSNLAAMLPLAHAQNLRVHAWVGCFQDQQAYNSGLYDTTGTYWIDPADTNYTAYLMSTVITPVLNNYPVDGIVLDYVRYPGNAAGNTTPINNFVAGVRAKINNTAPSVLLSAAVMPEASANAYYYGQDYAQMSAYLDTELPMTYTYSYGQPASWVGTVVNYMVTRVAATCNVQAIIETRNGSSYKSTADLDNERSIAESHGSEINVSYFTWPFSASQWTSIAE